MCIYYIFTDWSSHRSFIVLCIVFFFFYAKNLIKQVTPVLLNTVRGWTLYFITVLTLPWYCIMAYVARLHIFTCIWAVVAWCSCTMHSVFFLGLHNNHSLPCFCSLFAVHPVNEVKRPLRNNTPSLWISLALHYITALCFYTCRFCRRRHAADLMLTVLVWFLMSAGGYWGKLGQRGCRACHPSPPPLPFHSLHCVIKQHGVKRVAFRW